MTPGPYTTPRPCVRACTVPGQHVPGCGAGDCGCACHSNPVFPPPCDVPGGCRHTPDGGCRGCRPRQALPGGLVCEACWRQTADALADLLDLYDDLLQPTRAVASAGRVSGTAEARLALADGPRWVRAWIKGVLVEWRAVLARPLAPTKAQADAHRHAVKQWEAGKGPEPAPLPVGPYGRGLSAPDTDDPHRTHATVSVHLEWLLCQEEHAEQFVHDVLAMAGEARREAYPTRADGVLLGRCPRPATVSGEGVCGTPIRAHDPDTPIRCRGCHHTATAYGWRALMDAAPAPRTADGGAPLATAAVLAAWLSAEYGRVVTPEVVRQWAAAGTRHGRLPRAGRDFAGRTLHPADEAQRIAAALYGPPDGPPDGPVALQPAPAGASTPPPEE